MSQPNHRPGTRGLPPAQVYVSSESGALIGLPGAQKGKVKSTVEKLDLTDATIMRKGAAATYSTVTGTITVTGRTIDFIQWINGLQAGTATDMFQVIEEVTVVAGAGATTLIPAAADGGLELIELLGENGSALNQITGTPAAGEFDVAGTVLTLDGAAAGDYYAVYISTATAAATGTMLHLDLTKIPCTVNKMWLANTAISPDTGGPFANDKTEGLYLEQVVFHGDIPIFDFTPDDEQTYELEFTANLWAETDLLLYMPADPAGA